jgi:hypothetical protein
MRFIVTASREVTSDFPTPPLPLTTAMTFFTLLILCGFAFSLTGSFLSAQDSPQELQLWSQFSLIVSGSLYFV